MPSEDFEHLQLLEELAKLGITPGGGSAGRVAHVANETTSKMQAIRNKRMGVSRGFPDFVFARHDRTPMLLELKRANGKPSDVSAEQRAWGDALGGSYRLAFGHKQALEHVQEWLQGYPEWLCKKI